MWLDVAIEAAGPGRCTRLRLAGDRDALARLRALLAQAEAAGESDVVAFNVGESGAVEVRVVGVPDARA